MDGVRAATGSNEEQEVATKLSNILIISFSDISSDPRVMRQVRLMEARYRATVAGYGAPPDSTASFISIPDRRAASLPRRLLWGSELLLGLSDRYYWSCPEVQSAHSLLRDHAFDLVIANDIATVPLALRLAKGRPVLVDAHEFAPMEFEDKPVWRLLFGRYYDDLCRRYLPRAAAMTTVCSGIAEEYGRRYGAAPVIVENTPEHQPLQPSALEPGRVRLIHHGAAIRSRHIEAMIEMMRHLDERFTLDIMLVGNDGAYLAELRRRAASDQRIRFPPPVPMRQICEAINRYDLGLFLLPPVNFNYRHALPNKFFEFVQARLAVAIGPSPEMARYVHAYGLGVVAESFSPVDLAGRLTKLSSSDLLHFKQAAHRAAAQLNFEKGGATTLSLIDSLLRSDRSVAAGHPCAA